MLDKQKRLAGKGASFTETGDSTGISTEQSRGDGGAPRAVTSLPPTRTLVPVRPSLVPTEATAPCAPVS